MNALTASSNTVSGVLLNVNGPAVQFGDLDLIRGSQLHIGGRYELQSGGIHTGQVYVSGLSSQLLKTTSAASSIDGPTSALITDPTGLVSVQAGSLSLGGGGQPYSMSNSVQGVISVSPGATLRLEAAIAGINNTVIGTVGALNVGGTLEVVSNSSLTGSGQVNIQAASLPGGVPGVLRMADDASGNSRTISVAVNNSGIIEQNTRQTTVWGPIVGAPGSQFNLLGGTAELHTASTFGDLTINASTLWLGANLTVNGALRLTDAVVNGDSTGPSLIAAGSTVFAAGSGSSNWLKGFNLGVSGSGPAIQNGNLSLSAMRMSVVWQL